MTLHFSDWPGAASLRYRNHTEITVVLCEQKPYLLWLSRRRKGYTVKCEHQSRPQGSVLSIPVVDQKDRGLWERDCVNIALIRLAK